MSEVTSGCSLRMTCGADCGASVSDGVTRRKV
jgi:hypothetical protein